METEAVILKDAEHPLESQHTPLYAASITAGGELTEKGFCHAQGRKANGTPENITVWLFKNKEIVFKAFSGEVISQKTFHDRWNNHSWLASNPDHPITFMRYFLTNLQNARDFLKKHEPLVMERNGCRTAFVPADATEEEKEFIRQKLYSK